MNSVINEALTTLRRNLTPVYLCVRNRDVVCGILDQQTINCLLQVWPVIFSVVFYGHGIQDWVRGEHVRCGTVSTAHTGCCSRTPGPVLTAPALHELTELGGRVEGEFSLDSGWWSRAVGLTDFTALAV